MKNNLQYKHIRFSQHSFQRMFEREITPSIVREVIDNGIIIKEYPDDTPYPSFLVLGYHGDKPIHVVVSLNTDSDTLIIITVYIPDISIWNNDFTERRGQ